MPKHKVRGVTQAPFRVMIGATRQAVLVELGVFSNPDEEKKLKDAAYREQLVDALSRAVAHYKALVENRPEIPAAPGAVPSATPSPGGTPATGAKPSPAAKGRPA